jgi:hypothetical protein
LRLPSREFRRLVVPVVQIRKYLRIWKPQAVPFETDPAQPAIRLGNGSHGEKMLESVRYLVLLGLTGFPRVLDNKLRFGAGCKFLIVRIFGKFE